MLLVALALGCGSDPTAVGIVVSVTITPKRDTLAVGDTAAFSALVKNVNGDTVSGAHVVWKSDQPFLAAVDSTTGVVTAVAVGAAAITATVGPLTDTAQVFVVTPVSLAVALDTIALVVGDTFTAPVLLSTRSGAMPAVTFTGGSAGVATVDPQSGLVTAIANGFVAYQAHADTFTANGTIAVVNVADTAADGMLTAGLSGAITRKVNLAAKGYNFPTLDGGNAFQLAAVNPDTAQDHLTMMLMENVTGVLTRAIGQFPAGLADPVCHPPNPWAFYRHDLIGLRATSVSGTLSITSAKALTGGTQVSGRFVVTLTRTDQVANTGQAATLRGTFVIPVLTLASCPQ